MVKIRCVVERITYQNPDNGYSVLKCAVKNYNELVTVVGNLLDANVGPKFARKIVQQFGTDTLEIIETDVQRLPDVPGIGKKRVDKIAENWERQKEIKNIMLFLQDHGVSTAYAAKIYRQYGNESIQKVKENPFRLADDIWEIGFKTADNIADKLGIGKEAFSSLW